MLSCQIGFDVKTPQHGHQAKNNDEINGLFSIEFHFKKRIFIGIG